MNVNGLEFILILLVPLGVWIFSTIFKSDEERPGARPAPGSRPAPQRRPVTDLERFLEEARRRREVAERRQSEEAEKKARPVARSEARPIPPPERRAARPAPAPQSRRSSVDAPLPRTSRPPVMLEAVAEAIPAATPARRVDPARPDAPPVAALPVAVPLAAIAVEVTPAAPRDTSSAKPTPPTLVHLARLLRSPRTAGAAIVLREIFDQPLCRRRR
jgi:hypothetical protein